MKEKSKIVDTGLGVVSDQVKMIRMRDRVGKKKPDGHQATEGRREFSEFVKLLANRVGKRRRRQPRRGGG